MGLISLLFSFNGRIKRSQYWLGAMAVGAANSMLTFWTASASFSAAQTKDPGAQLSAVLSQSALLLPLSIAVTWAALAIQVKRFHDRGQSGWWTVLPLVPIVFMIMDVITAVSENWPIERLFAALGMPLLALIVICIGFFINLGCLPGTDGPNKYDNPTGSPPSARTDPNAPRGGPQSQAAISLGGVEAAMERAIAEKSRVAPAPVKTARPAMAAAPATAGAPTGFGRRPAR